MSNSFYTNVIQMGNKICFRGIIDGKRVKQRVPYKPKLYTNSEKPSKFRTLKGGYLEEIQFDDINDCRDFVKRYEEVQNFKIYGMQRYDYAFISDTFSRDIEWDLSKIVLAYIDIEVGSENGFPEPDKASEPVTAITLHVGGRFWVFGCGDFKTERQDITYFKLEDEKALLHKFIEIWVEYSPDIVTGWNTNQFDFPYLINRMERLFMGTNGDDVIKMLSPWNWIKQRTIHMNKKDINTYDISGVSMIDYIDLYKKFSANPSQESYKLDYIGSVEVGTKKIDYSEYEDLYTLYKRDFQKFIEYNIRDVEIVMKLEDKTRLLELMMTLAYDAKVNYEDVFSQVRMWDVIISNFLKKRNIIIPPKKHTYKKEQFEGAYVKTPKSGLYRWIASFDFTSLYPHLIMMYNISPETLLELIDFDTETETWFEENKNKISVEGMLIKNIDTSILKKKQLTLTPNGQLFRTDKKGFLAELMEEMYEDRSKYKKMMNEAKREYETATGDKSSIEKKIARYNNLQQAKKVCLNSAYGVIGSPFFRFFDVRIAEAITLSAQLSVIWIQQHLNKSINKMIEKENGDYVIGSDTDSVYVTFEPFVDKMLSQEKQLEMGPNKIIRYLDKFCQTVIAPKIEAYCVELSDYVNAYSQKLDMKREALADKAIWVKKKHYMINIYNNEGIEYAKPKLKIVGMDAIKSSTPGVCRNKLKEAFEILINKDEQTLRNFVNEFKEVFMALPVQDIAFPKGMNGLEKYDGGETIFRSKTPIHTKGALVFNHWLEKMNLTKKYQLIKDHEKLKYIYLKEPNPLQSAVIAFLTVIPDEFDLNRHIDYAQMFEKTFTDHITRVTNVIGWVLEPTSSLESLFS